MSRPPSASAHRKVLEATLELVAARGIDATSMDAVARKSGVSKATIYKHWTDKEALLLEMMRSVLGLDARPTFDSGDTHADILAVLAHRPPEEPGAWQRIMPHLVGYSASHPEFGQTWRHMVMDPPRRELRRLLKAGVDKGELSEELDVDLAVALLLGPLMYWHVFLRKTSGDPRRLAEAVVDAFWRAYGIRALRHSR